MNIFKRFFRIKNTHNNDMTENDRRLLAEARTMTVAGFTDAFMEGFESQEGRRAADSLRHRQYRREQFQAGDY